MKNIVKIILILGVLTMNTTAEKKQFKKYKGITRLSKTIFLDTNQIEGKNGLEFVDIDAVKFTKQNILPTVLRFKQAIIEKNIDELMTFYSEEEFYPSAQDDYARRGVKTGSMEEFKSVWKKDIKECKKYNRETERLRDQDRKMCILFLISDGLKTGEYIIQINLEPPSIILNYHSDMAFTLIIFDKKREEMWVGILFKQEGNTYKIIDNGGGDLLYMRHHYDPEHPAMPD
jgi:hypothetical protein